MGSLTPVAGLPTKGTLADFQEVVDQWDHPKNGNTVPSDVSRGVAKFVHHICDGCPQLDNGQPC